MVIAKNTKMEDFLEGVQEYMSYDKMTGEFKWIHHDRNPCLIGTTPGTILPSGRRRIFYKSKSIGSSRLAWYFVTGKLPRQRLIYINGDRSDDRFENLKEFEPGDNKLKAGQKYTYAPRGKAKKKGINRFVVCLRILPYTYGVKTPCKHYKALLDVCDGSKPKVCREALGDECPNYEPVG